MQTSQRFGTWCVPALVASLLCWSGSAQGVPLPSMTISPSSVSNTYAGQITLQIDGLTNGETVVVDRYLDVNTNGVIDAGDWLLQSLRLTDGQASVIGGVTNINVAYDANPTNATITAQLNFQTASFAQKLVGTHLCRLSSPNGRFAALTNSLTITNNAYAQWFTGQVQCNGTNVPYAGVLVLDNGNGPIAGTVANSSGTYTSKVAPGAYQLLAFKSNYVFDMGAAPGFTLSAGVPITTNLNLIQATRSISGRFVDATNSSLGLPGLMVVPQSTNNLIAIGFTGTNGNFAVPVTASVWEMDLDDQGLPAGGYLSPHNAMSVDTTTGNVSGATIALPKGTALFYGTVKDNQNHPLAGVQLYADDVGHEYEARGSTDTNGNYAIAVVDGSWHVTVSEDSPGYGNYVFSSVNNTNLTAGQAVRLDFTGSKGTTISGTVLGGGNPLNGANVQAGIVTFTGGDHWDWQWVAGTDVGSDGTYTLSVPPGTNYTVKADGPSGTAWLEQYYHLTNDVQGATLVSALTNAPATNINFNLQAGIIISGTIYGGGNPLAGFNVTVGTITNYEGDGWSGLQTYYANSTDSSGHYSVAVPPGTNYYMWVNVPQGSPWLFQFYGNATDPSGATVLAALTNTNINFNLQAGALISGRVRGNGNPLADASVEAGMVTFKTGGGWDWQFIANASTDTNGDFTLTVPPGTNYTLKADGSYETTWLEQYYSNVTDAASATIITALTNAPATNVNFNLHMGTTVSGYVQGGGVPLSGISVFVGTITNYTGGGWNWEQRYYSNNDTDSNGYYSVTVSPGTNYYVQVNPPEGSAWLSQLYSNATDMASARVIAALTNAPATNINFSLHQGAFVSGRVLGGGNPLAGVGVNVGTITNYLGGGWNWLQTYYGDTDSNGNYTVAVPPGTNYYAQANPPNGFLWLGQFFTNATDASSATVIAALTNAPATNINFNLQAGAIISGTIRGGGNPLNAAHVEAGIATSNGSGGWNWQWMAGAEASSNGTYSLTVPSGTNYIVDAWGPDGTAWLQQYYNLASDIPTATLVSALTNAPATNINFNLLQMVTITVNTSTNVGGSVTGGGTFVVGSTNQIAAVASNGWVFTGWSDGNMQNPRSIVVAAGGASYTANFALAAPANSFVVASIIPNGSSGVMSVSVAFDGTNYLVGIEGDQTGTDAICAQLVSPAGTPLGSPISVGRTGGAPYVAFDGTNYLMVWTDDARGVTNNNDNFTVYGQFVNPSGALVGRAFLISELPLGPIDERPYGLSFDGNNYLVVYGIGTNIHSGPVNQLAARFVSPAGVVGSEISLATAINAIAWSVNCTACNGTNYLVAWMQHDGSASNDVYGVLLSKTGTPSAPFRINQSTSTSQNPMSVASDGAKFFVVWPYDTGSGSEDPALWELHGRILTASGGFGSSEFTLAGVTNRPMFPFLAFDGANYLVTWTDMSNTNDWNIAGQLVTPSGALLGSVVNLVTSPGNQALSPVIYGNGQDLLLWNDGFTTNEVSFSTAIRGLFFSIAAPSNATVTVHANPASGGTVSGGGVYTVGTNVQIAAVASNGWAFIAWNDGATNNPYTITVPASDITYTATFARISTVSAIANPANGGSVVGAGIYIVGSNAVLTALASNNWLFTRWNDNSVVNPRTITVPPTNITYTAYFAAAATINVGANTNDGGYVTGSGVYFVGSNDVLTATASNGWQFIRWNDGSTNNPRTVVVAAGGASYTAIFAPTAVITVQANPANGGRVTGGGTYVVGSNVVLSATASNLWRFISWDDSVTNNPRTVVVASGGGTYTADFSPLGSVTVLASPTNGGSVTGGGQYLVGSNATVTATASNNWLFMSWNGSITNNPWVFSVPSGTTICTANFSKLSTVTVLASPTNAGSVVGGGQYLSGSNVSLTASASNNWLFTKWNDGTTNNPYAIVVPTTNITYTANFAATAVINVGANTNDGGYVTGSGVYFVGSNDVLTATASNGWQFIRWNDGSTNNPRTVVVASGGASYTAVFAPTAVLTVQASPVEGGRVMGGGTYVVGSNAVLSATASNLWRFISWDDSVTNNPRTVVVASGGGTYTADFSPLGSVTVLASPTNGGNVTGGGQYLVGSNATVTATASNNWLFMSWNGSITNNPWVFSVPSGTTICTANFSKLSTVTVLASPTNGGLVTGAGSYLSGSNVNLTAAAASTWIFSSWNDGNTNASRWITVPTTNIAYTATFIPPKAVTVLANPAYGGNVSGGGTFQVGSNVNISATAAAGWLFAAWNDGNTNADRSITVPASNIVYTANFARGIGAAVDATNLNWTTGGSANWAVQTATTHDGVAALQSGAIGAGQQTWFQTTTNGPGSLLFWWKVSSAPTNYLQFYINTQLVSQISGNVGWNQIVTFLGTSNQVTLKWVYTKNTAAVSGSDAGWVDQVTWIPCPYAEHVPQMFYQDPSGLLASWVLNSTGGFRFARVLANTGGWALKAAGDVDGDGVSDLLFQDAASNTGGWFMNPDGSVRDARFWFNIGPWEIKACGDYEGIGRGQLFFQTAAGQTAYWRLDTNGIFQASVPLGNMGGWKLRGVGDLDGDHKAELFWQNAAGVVAIWYHNPDDSIRGAVMFSTGPWALCGVVDIDGDGVSDLLWQTPDGLTGGWFMNSNSIPRSANFWWNTGAWRLKAAGR